MNAYTDMSISPDTPMHETLTQEIVGRSGTARLKLHAKLVTATAKRPVRTLHTQSRCCAARRASVRVASICYPT